MVEPNDYGFRSFLFSKAGLVLLGFSAIGAYFLWAEHEAHLKMLVPYWPYLLLLACPLLHVFMHHGHGGHGSHGNKSSNDERSGDRQ